MRCREDSSAPHRSSERSTRPRCGKRRRGRRPLSKLFSKEQRAFFSGERARGHRARRAGSSRPDQRPQAEVLAQGIRPPARRRAVALPRQHADPRALDQVHAERGIPGRRRGEGLPDRARRGPRGRAADEDAHGARVLLEAPLGHLHSALGSRRDHAVVRGGGDVGAGEAAAAPAAASCFLDRRGGLAVRRGRPRSRRGSRPTRRSVPRRRPDRRHQRGPAAAGRGAAAAVHARARLRARARRRRARAAARRRRSPRLHHGRLVRGRAARGARDGRGLDRARGRDGHERRRRVLAAGDPAHRAPPGRADPHGRPGDPLPGDRRPRAAGAAPRDARRKRADDGALDRGGRLPARRMGARPLLADGREPGRDPARVERGHPRVPVGGEGDRHADGLLGAAGTAPRSSGATRPAPACS